MNLNASERLLVDLVLDIQARCGPASPTLVGPLLGLSAACWRHGNAPRASALLRRAVAILQIHGSSRLAGSDSSCESDSTCEPPPSIANRASAI